jgi:hypothetical protein
VTLPGALDVCLGWREQNARQLNTWGIVFDVAVDEATSRLLVSFVHSATSLIGTLARTEFELGSDASLLGELAGCFSRMTDVIREQNIESEKEARTRLHAIPASEMAQ